MEILRGKQVVFKAGSKWYVGKVLKKSIKKLKQIKKLADAEGEHITLLQFLKDNKVDVNEKENILNEYGVDSLYIKFGKERPEQDSKNFIKEFEKYWWSEFCDYCKDCLEPCKQSAKVDVVYCARRRKE